MATGSARVTTITPGNTLLRQLFDDDLERLATFLLSHTYFIDPQKIRTLIKEHGHAAVFPKCVRASREHHPGAARGHQSIWLKQEVRVYDNSKARLAFARISKLVLSGDRPNRVRGYHVAHVWGRVFDPQFFTAAWNLCLIPGFLKLSTEEQDSIPLLKCIIQQAAFDTYFAKKAIGIRAPNGVEQPKLKVKRYLRGATLNFV
jgi:hypothetical protein